MEPVKIAEGIYEVGAVDWNIRDFHGYSTDLGTTYNSYLIIDEKIALLDTVKAPFADRLLANIARIVDPARIDYVVSNHTELDHSGGLARLMHRIGEDKPLYCSKMGHKNLAKHFRQPWNYRPVATGDRLPLGRRTLSFMESRMVHWPDSMMTYLEEDQILFSSDGFGQHYAGPEKFDDQIGDRILYHAKKYFVNILLLYVPLIEKLLASIADAGLQIRMICPDHGVIWRSEPQKIVEAYGRWCRQQAGRRAVVVYDTMWQSTARMAETIAAGLNREGVATKPMQLRNWHRSDAMVDVFDAKAVVVGSPTLNNNLYPTVADFLTYMKGLKPLNKIGAAFGSYGWSGEAVKQIEAELAQMRFEMIEPGLRVQYVPDEAALAECYEFGRRIGRAVNDALAEDER